jgi:hypothetical protein
MPRTRPASPAPPGNRRNQGTAPWAGEARPAARPQTGPKHDSLCLMQRRPDGLLVPSELGLTNCWCMSSCCWLNLGLDSKGRPTGRCICKYCPCHSTQGAVFRL